MKTTRRGQRGAQTFLTAAFVLLVACLLGPPAARAQWTQPDASNNINNTNTGNVGIGTNVPGFRLEVRGGASRNTASFTGDGDSVGFAGFRIQAFTTTGIAANRAASFNFHMRKDTWYGGDGSGPSFIIETTSKTGGFAAPFLITPTNDIILNGGQGASNMPVGRVGIGTTSPGALLDVRGSIALDGTVPAAHAGSGYSSLWLKNNVSLISEVASGYSVLSLGANYQRLSATGGWSNVNTSLPSWSLSMGAGPGYDQFQLVRSPAGTYNASPLMVVNSAGNVGIGTTSPVTRLHVTGQADNLFQVASTGSAPTDTVANFSSAVGNILSVRGNGNVGIGTGSPAFKLDVAGSVNSSGLCLAGDCKTAWSQIGGGSQWANGTASSISYSAGNVGVGTATADKLFTVQGQVPSIAGTMAVIRTTGANHGSGLALDAAGAGNNNLGFLVNGARKGVISWDNSRNFLGFINSLYSENDFALRLNSNGSLTYHDVVNGSAERFRLTAAGSVGIGTAAPERRLHVLGGSIEGQWSTTAGQGYGFFISRDNNHVAENAYFTGTEWRAIKAGKAAVFHTYTSGNYAFYVQSDDVSRAAEAPRLFSPVFVIQTDGRVGVGTTTPGQKLDVTGNVNATGLCIAGDCKTAWSQVGGGTTSQWANGANSSINYVSGAVGIGTASPARLLDIVGSGDTKARAVGGAGAAFQLQETSGTPTWAEWQQVSDRLRLNMNDGTTTRADLMTVLPTGNVGIGTANPTAALDVVGDIKATGSVSATYQDVAEWVPSAQKLRAGTVVVLDEAKVNHVTASSAPYDTKVAGVISETPGVILGVAGEGKVKVATTGRVKVRVDATRGAVKVGDLLVTSEVEGVAMKSVPVDLGGTKMHRPGTIIGKALEPLEKGVGEILVLLSLQ